VKIAPLVAKKPKRGFYIPSPEKTPPREEVTAANGITPDTITPAKDERKGAPIVEVAQEKDTTPPKKVSSL
jgi:hypothetical protein